MRARLATESDARAIGNASWPYGEQLGSWRVVAPLGRGGTAEVWLARDAAGREAALKIPKADLRAHAAASVPLRREHAVLRRVASAHVVRPLELFEANGVAVLALEHLPHGDLVALAGAPLRHWLDAVRAVVAALVDLERCGLAHGDVKARNVLFAGDGGARLIDLSTARPLEAPAVCATAACAPPAAAGATAAEADCFALAALLYELATGRLPYGPHGAAARGEVADVPPCRDPAAARLLAAAVEALRAGGRGLRLSYLGAVIESVRASAG
jgi:serine/threonine-protein kinase